jgi:hypothetical protein
MFDAPRAANSSAPPDNYIQPNLGHGLRIWWAFYWRTALGSGVLSAGVNITLRYFSDDPASVLISRYDAYIFYYLTAFFMIAYILRKDFRSFRIGLLSSHGGEGAQLLPQTLRRTARVWWTFCWRAVVYRIIVAVVASFPLGWILGFLAAVLAGPKTVALVNLTLQIVLDGAVGMFVIYSNILDEDISDFRVALVPRTASTGLLTTAAVPAVPIE